MEHLQKIPYLLSIFFPIALFFSLGLWFAYLLWHKHTRRLVIALKKNNELNGDLARIYDAETTNTGTTPEELEQIEANWQQKLEAETNKYSELDLHFSNFKSEKEQEFTTLLDNNHSLQAGIEGKSDNSAELEAKIAALQSKYSSSQDSISELTTKLKIIELEQEDAPDLPLTSDLESKLTSLQGQLSTKDEELNKLKTDLEASKSESGELTSLKNQFSNLQGQLDGKDSEVASLQQELNSAKSKISAASSSTVKVTQLAPAAFFAGSNATKNDRFGHIFDGNNKPSYIDNLTEVKGVGEVLQPKLNEFGIYQFKQIALWDQSNIDAFSEDLDFPGRVEREQWVNQAADLHRNHHGEHLAPVVDIYHPAPQKTQKSSAEITANFSGEDVKEDEKLGLIYTSRPDEVDDLKLIKGVAKVLEAKLHEIGIYKFKQIVNWDETHMTEFSNRLAFPGRIQRDDWKTQATQFYKDKYGSL